MAVWECCEVLQEAVWCAGVNSCLDHLLFTAENPCIHIWKERFKLLSVTVQLEDKRGEELR
jgi:hypothetical protein